MTKRPELRKYNPMLIYKIFQSSEWAALQKTGETDGAPVDLADGFIHFSTAQQVGETAAKHFANLDNLFLAAVDPASMGTDLKWEVSRGGAEFPHLYRALRLSDLAWCAPLPLRNGTHIFPDEMT